LSPILTVSRTNTFTDLPLLFTQRDKSIFTIPPGPGLEVTPVAPIVSVTAVLVRVTSAEVALSRAEPGTNRSNVVDGRGPTIEEPAGKAVPLAMLRVVVPSASVTVIGVVLLLIMLPTLKVYVSAGGTLPGPGPARVIVGAQGTSTEMLSPLLF